MKWYQIKEQAAGEKRLMLLWYIYKIFGKNIVRFITIFIAFFTFIFAKPIRKYSHKNLGIIYNFTQNQSAKPTIYNCFKLILNYAWSLIDRMETFANRYPVSKLIFDSDTQKHFMEEDIKNKRGIIFICSHIGNVEVLRTFVQQPQWSENPHVNVFLSEEQCKIFNKFLKKIQVKTKITTYPVEQVGIETVIELEEKLNKGEVIFIAGDRVSKNTGESAVKLDFLGHKTDFPTGSFHLAQLMDASIYFISAIKNKNDRYKVYLEKFEKDNNLKKSENIALMQNKYCNFLEKIVQISPLQFYHFYEMFGE